MHVVFRTDALVLIADDKAALKDYDYFPGLEIDADRPVQD